MQKSNISVFAQNLSRNATFFALKRQITFEFSKKCKKGPKFAFLSRVFTCRFFLEQKLGFHQPSVKSLRDLQKIRVLNLDRKKAYEIYMEFHRFRIKTTKTHLDR